MKRSLRQRNANIEMLRILAMIMVIMLHSLAGSGALYEQSGFSYHFYWWMEALAVCAVDVFVLISGYFLIDSKFKLQNVFRILIITWTFSLLFSLLSVKISGTHTSFTFLLKMFFPVLTKKYWFVNAYLAMYLLSPFINKLIRCLNKQQFTILLWIIIAMMIIRPTLFPKVWAQDLTAGLSVFFFIALYLIAVWIHMYGNEWKINSTHCILVYFLLSLFLVVSKAVLLLLGISEDTASRYYSYDSAVVVLEALALFLGFLNFKPITGRKAEVVIFVAQYSFAAYIIHYALNDVLWRRILHLDHIVGNLWIGPVIILISSVLIFLSCAFLDWIRSSAAEWLVSRSASTKIAKIINRKFINWNEIING